MAAFLIWYILAKFFPELAFFSPNQAFSDEAMWDMLVLAFGKLRFYSSFVAHSGIGTRISTVAPERLILLFRNFLHHHTQFFFFKNLQDIWKKSSPFSITELFQDWTLSAPASIISVWSAVAFKVVASHAYPQKEWVEEYCFAKVGKKVAKWCEQPDCSFAEEDKKRRQVCW